MKPAKWFCALLAVLFAPQSSAAGFDEEFDEKPWSEVEVQLPAFPAKDNLIAFRVGAVTDTQFLIDGSSISVGSDGVIRFTLVVESAQGARNISYEGMRCSTGERRFYASGRSDKTWSKARSNKWIRILGTSNNHYVELAANNFCVGGLISSSADEARRVLRQGGTQRYVY